MSESFAEWIGRSIRREDVASPRLLAEYRATMLPWLYQPGAAEDCPPGFHWGLAPAFPSFVDTGPDGAEAKGTFLPPIPLPRRMWAGGSIETFRAIRLGSPISRTSTIADIKFREGKAGQLYLVSVLHDLVDGNGPLLRERQDLVFREASSRPSGGMAGVDAGDAGWKVDATPLLLFRFSAFTFNGHRIHYDAHYAAEEGYPGLVVHGPLQAALMLNLAAQRLGHVPPRFDYRCVAPLFAGQVFDVGYDSATGTTSILRHDRIITAEGRVHARET